MTPMWISMDAMIRAQSSNAVASDCGNALRDLLLFYCDLHPKTPHLPALRSRPPFGRPAATTEPEVKLLLLSIRNILH